MQAEGWRFGSKGVQGGESVGVTLLQKWAFAVLMEKGLSSSERRISVLNGSQANFHLFEMKVIDSLLWS